MDLWFSCAVLLIALILRFPLLFCGLYTDEGGTYFDIANPTLTAVLRHAAATEFNPPGYFVLLWLWTRVTGLSEVLLKLPSFITGLGLVMLVYLLGRLTDSRTTAVLGSILITLSITATVLSAAARPYALAGVLSALAILAFLRIFYSRTPVQWSVTFSVIMSALAFVHYSALILLVGLLLGATVIATRDLLWKRFMMFALASALVVVACLPQLPVLLHDSSPLQVRSWLKGNQTGSFGARFLEQLGFIVPFVVMRLQIASVALVTVGFLAVVHVKRWLRDGQSSSLATPIIATITCVLSGTFVETLMFMHEQRYMFVFAPLGCLLLALALRWSWNVISRRSSSLLARIVLTLVLVWLAAGVASGQAAQYVRLYRNLELSGLRGATETALSLNGDGHTLFLLVPDASAGVFQYYTREKKDIEIVLFPRRLYAPSALHIATAPIKSDNWRDVLAQIDSLLPSRFDRIAVIEVPTSFANSSQARQAVALLNTLSCRYRKTFQRDYAGYQESASLEVFENPSTHRKQIDRFSWTQFDQR